MESNLFHFSLKWDILSFNLHTTNISISMNLALGSLFMFYNDIYKELTIYDFIASMQGRVE